MTEHQRIAYKHPLTTADDGNSTLYFWSEKPLYFRTVGELHPKFGLTANK